MDADLLARVDDRVLRGIADSVAPGAALAVARHGKLVRLRGYGRLDWDPASVAVTPFSLYDIASLTKVVGTATAVMILSSEGLLGLDDPVVRYLPEFARGDPRKADITVRDLLLHRGGLPPFEPFYDEVDGLDQMKEAVYDLPLASPPRAHAEYSDIGFMVLGWVVEAASGEPLASFVDRRIMEPLGMSDTGYTPDSAERARIAPTERGTAYRPYHIRGEVHDENAHAMGGVAGHAGLFATAQDLAVFAAVMASGGMLERCDYVAGAGTPCGATSIPIRTRMWDGAAVRAFTTRVGEGTTPSGEPSSWALGWDTPSGASTAGDYFSERSFGLTGFTGTSIWIDPELDLFVVLLTNRVNPTRENTRHAAFRRELHDLVATAVNDRVVLPRGDR
jgi:CubicO group peptidase (beta-lactamase class C family)